LQILAIYFLGPGTELTDDGNALLVHNSTGQEMKVELRAISHHSVSSIIAALWREKIEK